MSDLIIEEPEKLGFNRERLDRIPRFFESYVEGEKMPGFSVLIARDGKIGHFSHFGKSGIGEGFDVDEQAIFRIYSMTKPITSVALMMLIEQGKAMLYDDITKYIPAFKDVRVFDKGTPQEYTTREPERMITLHDLITHQSGLTYDFMLSHPVDALYRNAKINGARSEGFTLEQLGDALAKMPLVFTPGAQWNYSVSTDILGRVIEIISGQPLDVFFEENILQPLDMSDTSFTIADNKRARLMNNYNRNPLTGEIKLADGPEKTVYEPGRAFLSGGGGLLSTLADYHKFADMLRRGGVAANGTRIVSRKTIEFMTQNHLPNNETLQQRANGSFSEVPQQGIGFGLGVSVVVDSSATIAPISEGSYSWGGLASTIFWNDPVEDLVVVMMTQIMPSGVYPLRPQLQQLVYAALD